MPAKETVPYHFRSYKDGRYSFVEYDSVEETTKAIDFARGHEQGLIDNFLVWGSTGRGESGYVTDADFESPVPGSLKAAFVILAGIFFLILVVSALTRYADEPSIEERIKNTT
jgi:hypothetical protein